MSESLRLEMLPFGVKVVLIEPGNCKTEIWGKVNELPDTAADYARAVSGLAQHAAHNAEHAADPVAERCLPKR